MSNAEFGEGNRYFPASDDTSERLRAAKQQLEQAAYALAQDAGRPQGIQTHRLFWRAANRYLDLVNLDRAKRRRTRTGEFQKVSGG